MNTPAECGLACMYTRIHVLNDIQLVTMVGEGLVERGAGGEGRLLDKTPGAHCQV